MRLVFEWDKRKAASNLRRHKVSFDEAKEVFFDNQAVTYRDEVHSIDEDRLITIGMSSAERHLLVVHTETEKLYEEIVIRIISCRKATRTERQIYEKQP